jgi:hypothetical protein
MEHAAQQVGLDIPEELRDGVRQNLDRAKLIAKPLLDLSLGTGVESATVYVP